MRGLLSASAQTALGPYPIGVGRIFQHALVGRSANNDLSRPRRLQDGLLKYGRKSLPGVTELAEVSRVGAGCPDTQWC